MLAAKGKGGVSAKFHKVRSKAESGGKGLAGDGDIGERHRCCPRLWDGTNLSRCRQGSGGRGHRTAACLPGAAPCLVQRCAP
jgi:hypothetical protein